MLFSHETLEKNSPVHLVPLHHLSTPYLYQTQNEAGLCTCSHVLLNPLVA